MTTTAPPYQEFRQYAYSKIKEKGDDPENYSDWLKDKYEAWQEAGWKKEKNGKFVDIKIWRTTLLQCLPYRQANKIKPEVKKVKPLQSTGKVMEIENELIISAWNHWKVMQGLKLRHEECFDTLLQRGVFKKGTEPMENGKPWQIWYDKLAKKAILYAFDYAKTEKWIDQDIQRLRHGKHPILERFVKLEALKYFFSKYETENRLIDKLKTL